jgi:hypothetical protein
MIFKQLLTNLIKIKYNNIIIIINKYLNKIVYNHNIKNNQNIMKLL